MQTITNLPDLKPCPFCGGEAEMRVSDPFGADKLVRVICHACKSAGQAYSEGKSVFPVDDSKKYTTLEEAEQKAVAAWNQRIYAGGDPECRSITRTSMTSRTTAGHR